MTRSSVFIILLLLGLPAYADISGRVVGVHDGDTLTLLTVDKRQVKIRAADIDAPELRQPFGSVSKAAMSDLVFGKHVTITRESHDRYGRTVGVILIPYAGGAPITANSEMVRHGMAWVYVRYNQDPALLAIETEARATHRGLWRDPRAVPPWDWRRSKHRE